MSRGFLCALGGIGVTLLAWYGPWAWPAWPAFFVIDLVFGKGGFSELPYAQRAATVVALIAINVAFWGAAMRLLLVGVEKAEGRKRKAESRKQKAEMDSRSATGIE